jgi:CBS domain-containing protein
MHTVSAAIQETVHVRRTTTVQQASAAMLDHHVESAVLLDGSEIDGLLSADDVARALAEGRDATSTPVHVVAAPDPLLVDMDEPLAEVHQRMRAAQRPLAVVVDHDGRPIGVLADHEAAP